jgi:hypothetical protein
MEFENQYLTYEEYIELGGTLDETPFNILELEAQKNIDKYTFGRLQNLEQQTNEVKVCIFKLISLIDTYNSYENQNKSISSENIDGYSVTYSQATENVSKSKIEDIKCIIKTYLAECKLEDDTPYLYVGV